MRAMVLDRPGTPLVMREWPTPAPGRGEVLVEIAACGVCRTDLHVVDGELTEPKLPIVPGHEIVGRVAALGEDVGGFALRERIGVPWLGYTCGVCPYCRDGRENLCDAPLFTGYTRDGGYATHTIADARYCFPLPGGFDDFVLHPYVPEELYGRIRALEWRRSEFATEERHKVAGIVVDKAGHEVYVDGKPVQLTAKEFSLLAYLCERRGKVLSREHLLARVWGNRYEGGPRTVDIHVRRLRAKLGSALPLETLRGSGYKLRAPDSDEKSTRKPDDTEDAEGAEEADHSEEE